MDPRVKVPAVPRWIPISAVHFGSSAKVGHWPCQVVGWLGVNKKEIIGVTREQTLSWTYVKRKNTETDLHLKKPVVTTKTSVDHMHLLYQLCQVVFLEHSVNLHKIGAKLQKIHCCWWLYDDLPGMILVWHSNVGIVAASIPVHGLACMRPVRHNSKASSCAASFPRWNAYRNNERCTQNMGEILVTGNWPLFF